MLSNFRHFSRLLPKTFIYRPYTSLESQNYYQQILQGNDAPFLACYNLLRSGFKMYEQHRPKYIMLFNAVYQAKMTLKKEGNLKKAEELNRKMLDFLEQMRGVGISTHYLQEYYHYLMD